MPRLLTVVFSLLTLLAFSSLTDAANPDPFQRAVDSLCPDKNVRYTAAADYLLRKELNGHPNDAVPNLLLGMAYAEALTSQDVKVKTEVRKYPKRINRENAETLLRAALETLTSARLSDLDSVRLRKLKDTRQCGFSNDVQLAGRIAASIRSMNALRRAWSGSWEKTYYDFEGFFLLSPGSTITFPTLTGGKLAYESPNRNPVFLRSWEVQSPLALQKGQVVSLHPGFTMKAYDSFHFGGARIYYVFMTSNPVPSGGLNGKVFALEAGHYSKLGCPDTGAITSDGCLFEVTLNRKVKDYLVPMIRKEGGMVLQNPSDTKESKEIQSDGEPKFDTLWHGFMRWVDFNQFNKKKIDAMVSIHHNSGKIADKTVSYYAWRSRNLGRVLAEDVQDTVRSGRRDLISIYDNRRTYYINNENHPELPSVLIEVQYLQTAYDRAKKNEANLDEHSKKAAQGLLRGLRRYFSGDVWPQPPLFDTGLPDW